MPARESLGWNETAGSMANRMKELEEENARLNGIVANQAIDMTIRRETPNPHL